MASVENQDSRIVAHHEKRPYCLEEIPEIVHAGRYPTSKYRMEKKDRKGESTDPATLGMGVQIPRDESDI